MEYKLVFQQILAANIQGHSCKKMIQSSTDCYAVDIVSTHCLSENSMYRVDIYRNQQWAWKLVNWLEQLMVDMKELPMVV
jgi:hypothetical protein